MISAILGFEGPLGALIDFVNRDAGLVSPESSAGVRIQSALSDRLKLVQYFKDHPEAAGRTYCAGLCDYRLTTHRLYHGASPAFRRAAADGSTGGGKQHFLSLCRTKAFTTPAPGRTPPSSMVDWLLTQWPDFESIDPMDAMAVNEEVVLLDRTFLSTTYDSMMPIHDYGMWQADQNHEPCLSGSLSVHAGHSASTCFARGSPAPLGTSKLHII